MNEETIRQTVKLMLPSFDREAIALVIQMHDQDAAAVHRWFDQVIAIVRQELACTAPSSG